MQWTKFSCDLNYLVPLLLYGTTDITIVKNCKLFFPFFLIRSKSDWNLAQKYCYNYLVPQWLVEILSFY